MHPSVVDPSTVDESGSGLEVVGSISGGELRILMLREDRLMAIF